MATALQPLRWTARSCNCRESVYRYVSSSLPTRRGLSTTRRHWEESRPTKGAAVSKERVDTEATLKKFEQGNESIINLLQSVGTSKNVTSKDLSEGEFQSLGHAAPTLQERRQKKPKDTFLNLGDPDPWEEDGQLEDDHDEITTLGHGELERHREMRHYARLAAWEMPLLAEMAKTFEPPTADMPLRFRYTSYLGEQHPAEKKVVLEFCPKDMPDLTKVQREKLKKLAGSRYNPDKDIIKMSCDSFESQAQNKRYLGDLVDNMLHESRTGDTFEDVPLDLRHHRVKPKLKFPKAWLLTDKRKAHLEQIRIEETQRLAQQELAGSTLDGKRLISEGMSQARAAKVAEPELVAVGKAKKKVSVRR